MIQYQKILDKNMLNVFKDILVNIRDNGLTNNNHLYITFLTNHKNVELPIWLKEKYPKKMTIVIQYEYYNLSVNKNDFNIGLSFNNKKSNLLIPFNSVISFADPSNNFGLNYKFNKLNTKKEKNIKNNKKNKNSSNVIDFTNYKKN